MRYLLFFVCLHSSVSFGQLFKPYESMADAATAIRLLQTEAGKQAANPEWHLLIGQKKLQLQAYDSAIFYCNQSIALLARTPNDILLIRALQAKGTAQYYLDDPGKAEANWREALQLALKLDQYEAITKLASNLGAVYLDEEYLERKNIAGFHTADSFFAIAYQRQLARDSLASEQGLRTLRLMATSLHLQKKYDSADAKYRKVIALSKTANVNTYLGALTFYAELLSERGRHEEALGYAREALQWASQPGVTTKDQTHIMHVYGSVLFKSGRFKEAYQFNDSSFRILISDYEKQNAKAYSESESKFKNQLLQYEVALERQRKNKLYLLVAGLVLFTVVILLWFMNRSNKRIAKEKAKQKQVSIDAFIEGEEKEKVRIGRELHDGIAQEIVAIKLAMQQAQADSKLIDELNRISLDIRNISHELMPQTLKEYGLAVALEDVCAKILAPSGVRYEMHVNLPAERLANKIEITLYRIFQELVHNIFKHSRATEVLVQLRIVNHHIILLVEDNGEGMTAGKTGGIGLKNLQSRVQLLDGSLQYDSSESEGTTAIIRVPV